MRADLNTIRDWIRPGSYVLDLGCGDGELLDNLQRTRNISGYGLEIADKNIPICTEKGINVIQADLNKGLSFYFEDQAFDYVLMTQALQAVSRPDILIDEMLRVGKEAIVTFPNMGFWKNRMQTSFSGTRPVTRALPNPWYSSPNIHLCTLKDFEIFCKDRDIRILRREVADYTHNHTTLMDWFPNVFGEIAIYHFTRRNTH